MNTWLVALWISTCGVNGEYVPCTATRILEGPISQSDCLSKISAMSAEDEVYSCAAVKKDNRFMHKDVPSSPMTDEGNSGRYQIHGNEKVYE